jgi:proton glutamate symport protein
MGIGSAGSFKTLGKVTVKSLLCFAVATTTAILIGMTFINVFHPGRGLNLAAGTPSAGTASTAAAKSLNLVQYLVDIVPINVVDAMARQDILQMVVWATVFGIATAMLGEEGKPMVKLAEMIAKIMFKFMGIIYRLAPYGIGAMMAFTVGKFGLAMLIPLAKYILVVWGALLFFVALMLAGPLIVCGISLRSAIRALKDPFLVAFTTTAGDTAIPVSLERLEEFGVPRHIYSFTVLTAATFNLTGSTLYIAAATMFVGQVYGFHPGLAQQFAIFLTLTLATKGVSKGPGGSLVVLAAVLSTVGFPVEGIGIVLGIDRVLDMPRTGINAISHCVAAMVVAKWEKALGRPVWAAEALAGSTGSEGRKTALAEEIISSRHI